MAKTNLSSKAALAQQRAELKRTARGKAYIGDDAGASAGRAAERARVHQLQVQQRARERSERLKEPWSALMVKLLAGGAKLAWTAAMLPLRLVAALRGTHPRPSHA